MSENGYQGDYLRKRFIFPSVQELVNYVITTKPSMMFPMRWRFYLVGVDVLFCNAGLLLRVTRPCGALVPLA